MNKKERFLAAVRNEIPDRVPVAPDISNYIPCKRTGLPYWDIYFRQKIPLWRAYLEAADYFGIDPWIASCTSVPYRYDDSRVEQESSLEYREDKDAMFRRTTYHTPDGDLESLERCNRSDPPVLAEKVIKNLEADWHKFKWLCSAPTGIDLDKMNEIRRACETRKIAFGLCVSYSGFQAWDYSLQGSVQALSYAMMDTPEYLDEWFEMDLEIGTRKFELLLAQKPDYILFGGSGTITMASPSLARKYALPGLKKWSEMAQAAGIPTMLHSCGISRCWVDMLAEETAVGLINPLEIAPMGDVDLAEVKQARGGQISLMGNLHTTDIMLRGTPDDVRREAVQALQDAGEGGGFILSTGDQCGRDTPDNNIFALVEVAKEYGVYDRRSGSLPALAALAAGAER